MTDPRTPTRILDAAERLFAERGFARTTIKAIGTEAGVNSALLYYYFTDKERLYRNVLQRLMDTLIERTSSRLQAGGTPEGRVLALVQAQAEVLAANPNFPRLMVRELAESDAGHAGEQIRHLAATTFTRLCTLVRDGQASGAFRKEIDPRFAAISIVSQVAYFFVAKPAVRILLASSPGGPSPAIVIAYARHAANFALAALAAPSRSRSSRRPRRIP
ncbi:MAG: TetR/AcrR family transcriptional regulator [Gemmatimonadales bacterium]